MEMYYLPPAERGCVLLLVVSTTSPHPYSYLERVHGIYSYLEREDVLLLVVSTTSTTSLLLPRDGISFMGCIYTSYC